MTDCDLISQTTSGGGQGHIATTLNTMQMRFQSTYKQQGGRKYIMGLPQIPFFVLWSLGSNLQRIFKTSAAMCNMLPALLRSLDRHDQGGDHRHRSVCASVVVPHVFRPSTPKQRCF